MALSPSSDARFRRLFDEHEAAMRAYCKRRLSIQDANDAVAEIFVVVWRKIDEIPPGPETRLWLYGVARNAVRNAKSSHRRRTRLVAKVGATRENPAVGPDDLVVRRSEDRLVLEAMAQLQPRDQEVLRLHLWEELSHGDVGKVLGISPDAARVRLARATKRMARALRAAGYSTHISAPPRVVEEEGG